MLSKRSSAHASFDSKLTNILSVLATDKTFDLFGKILQESECLDIANIAIGFHQLHDRAPAYL